MRGIMKLRDAIQFLRRKEITGDPHIPGSDLNIGLILVGLLATRGRPGVVVQWAHTTRYRVDEVLKKVEGHIDFKDFDTVSQRWIDMKLFKKDLAVAIGVVLNEDGSQYLGDGDTLPGQLNLPYSPFDEDDEN